MIGRAGDSRSAMPLRSAFFGGGGGGLHAADAHMGDSDSAVPMVFMLAVLLVARLTDGFLFSPWWATVVSVIGVELCVHLSVFRRSLLTITGYPLTFVTMFAVS